jgi:hypothetical protein
VTWRRCSAMPIALFPFLADERYAVARHALCRRSNQGRRHAYEQLDQSCPSARSIVRALAWERLSPPAGWPCVWLVLSFAVAGAGMISGLFRSRFGTDDPRRIPRTAAGTGLSAILRDRCSARPGRRRRLIHGCGRRLSPVG